MADEQDDLVPSMTAGYKPGEKKTLEELAKLDEQDESLKKWKESLGLKGEAGRGAFFLSSSNLSTYLIIELNSCKWECWAQCGHHAYGHGSG